MTRQEYINKLFENLDDSLMSEAKARSATRRIVLELRRIINIERPPKGLKGLKGLKE
jgi:hypothetical protein